MNVDTDVKNGQTYYYAVVSYDHGLVDTSITGELVGLTPAECTSKIEADISGNIRVDINTAVATPRAPAAGYVNADTTQGEFIRQTIGTGEVEIDFLIPDSTRNGHTYRIEFGDTSYYHHLGTPFYQIYDITNGNNVAKTDTVWIDEKSISPLIDGFVVTIHNDETDLDFDRTGWEVGNTDYRWRVNLWSLFSNPDPTKNYNMNYPADFEFLFSDQIIDTAENILLKPDVPTKFSVYNSTEGKDADFMFLFDENQDSTLGANLPGKTLLESAIIWVPDPGPIHVRTSWRLFFETDSNMSQQNPPAPGDLFIIRTKKPFRTGDQITFEVRGPDLDLNKAKDDMNEIAVVPNPYVVAASWEAKSPYKFGRGERKLFFIHLPKQCTIRIYTLRGYLVDVIEHNGTIDDGQQEWNMLSKDGQEISYGVYIYHVDAPDVGEKIGKFAVIK
jgi:hypothetical protein